MHTIASMGLGLLVLAAILVVIVSALFLASWIADHRRLRWILFVVAAIAFLWVGYLLGNQFIK